MIKTTWKRSLQLNHNYQLKVTQIHLHGIASHLTSPKQPETFGQKLAPQMTNNRQRMRKLMTSLGKVRIMEKLWRRLYKQLRMPIRARKNKLSLCLLYCSKLSLWMTRLILINSLKKFIQILFLMDFFGKSIRKSQLLLGFSSLLSVFLARMKRFLWMMLLKRLSHSKTMSSQSKLQLLTRYEFEINLYKFL